MFQTFCWNFLIETFSNNPFHSRGFQISKPAICHYQVIQAVTKLYPQTFFARSRHFTFQKGHVNSLTIPRSRSLPPGRFFGGFSMARIGTSHSKRGPFLLTHELQVLHPSTAFPATAVVTWIGVTLDIQISPEVGCFSYGFFWGVPNTEPQEVAMDV